MLNARCLIDRRLHRLIVDAPDHDLPATRRDDARSSSAIGASYPIDLLSLR